MMKNVLRVMVNPKTLFVLNMLGVVFTAAVQLDQFLRSQRQIGFKSRK